MRVLMKVVVFVALVAFGHHMWNKTMADEAATSAEAGTNENGFVETPPLQGSERNVVTILAPENCPSDQAQRAAALDEALTGMGIPHTMGDSMSFDMMEGTPENRAKVDAAVKVFNQGAPAVFINGMAKSNPTAEEVAAEYRRTKGGSAS